MAPVGIALILSCRGPMDFFGLGGTQVFTVMTAIKLKAIIRISEIQQLLPTIILKNCSGVLITTCGLEPGEGGCSAITRRMIPSSDLITTLMIPTLFPVTV